MKQLKLKFPVRKVTRRRYVTYSEKDQIYLDRCRRGELKILESFLIESRAQRLGCTEGELRSMRNYELNRELADEEFLVLTSCESDYEPPPFIDWELINATSKRKAQELHDGYLGYMELLRAKAAEKPKRKSRKRRTINR